MSLNLEILSTTTIKRKKPWSKTYWLGKEKEQLVLLDTRRVSYLQLHNGETKKNIGHLNRYLEDTIKLFYHDENIIALLSNGDIVIWNKDSDVIYLVKGLPSFPATSKGKKDKKSSSPDGYKKRYDITVNNNLRNIAVIVDFDSIYIWYGEKPIFSKVTSPSASKKVKELVGSWFSVPIDNDVSLPNVTEHKNGILTISFNKNHRVISSPFQCIYSYTSENTLRVPVLTISPSYSKGYEKFQNKVCFWKNYNFPLKDIHPECHSIQHSGSLAASLSHNGLTLALAINQLATQAAELVFISMLNGSLVSTSLKNYSLGQAVTMRKKYLWISEITWSYDDCFVVCITKEGSLCVASQLGELLRISLTGCSLKLGPAFYPNLYPLVKPSSKETLGISNDDDSVSTTSGSPNFKQRFSVTSHPRVPLFLTSDGYLVTLIRFPQSHSGLVQTSSWFLQEANVALKPFRQMTGHRRANRFINESIPKKSVKASLEAADIKESWKILSTIDLTENNNSAEDIRIKSTRSEWESRQLRLAGSYLVSLWGLLSSYNNSWTQPLHSLASKSVELISEIVEISLSNEISFSSRCPNIEPTPFDSVTKFAIDLFKCLAFDGVLFNMLSTSVAILNKIVGLFSTNIEPEIMISTTRFLLKMERSLFTFYNVNLSRNAQFVSQTPENESFLLDDIYSYGNFNHSGNDQNLNFQEVTTCYRLKPAWFLLYKRAISNYRAIEDEKIQDEWREILCLLQKEIQERGWDVNVRNLSKLKKKLDQASQIYLKGHVERATEMWIKDLKNNERSTSSRKLHRILYSLLSQYKLTAVFTFVFGFVRGSFPREILKDVNNSEDAKKRVLYSIMKRMDSQNITTLVQSFARIWFSYYNKKMISIYPIHRAHSILSEKQVYKGLRSYPLISPLIMDSLSSQKMDIATNPTLVLELLLFGGLWFESVAFLFSQTINNDHFRLAFALAAIWSKTNNLIWRARSSIFTPDLEPENIILDQLKFLPSVSNKDSKPAEECSEEFVSEIRDLLLPAAICDLDLTPVILEDIVDQLTQLLMKAALLVPNETYLPAPPIYCPQQSIGYEEGDMPSEDTEDGFRHSVATLIERFFRVIQASFLGFPLMAWYFSFIEKLWAAAGWNSFGETAFSNLQFSIVTCLDINSSSPEIANAIQWLSLETSEGGQRCLQSLRNLLSLIWMLNCRDELSIACRNMHQFILGDEAKKGQNPNNYFAILDQVLYWCEKISPFRSIISSASTLENIVFNTANEISFSEDLVSRIIQCFLNTETLSLSGQNQLSNLITKWENYLSDSTKYKLKTFDDCRLKEIEKRNLLGQRIGKRFKKKCPILKIGRFEDYSFELEEEFLNIAEPVFHIGILKRLSQSPYSQASVPLLTTFSKKLRHAYFLSANESIKTLVNLEKQSSKGKSLLELIEEANSSSPHSVLSSQTMNFLKTPGKRQSVLFRQPIGSFWSPSRRVVEKFHRLVTEVRSQRNTKPKSKNRKINTNAVAKWKSTANLVMEELSSSGRLTNLNKSVSVSNLFSQSVLRPRQTTIGKTKGYANKIPDLVVELQMKSNEDESILPFISWILSWASNGTSNIHLLPSHVLLALVLESRRKVCVNDGRLSLVRVKIEQGIDAAKKPVSRSLSLRIPDKLTLTPTMAKEVKEAQTLEYFQLRPKKVEENRANEREIKSNNNDIKLPRDINANLPNSIANCEDKEIHSTKPVPPKKFSLPQVYQECWNKPKENLKNEPSRKFNEKIAKIASPNKINEDNLDSSKLTFDRNSPQRHSVRRKKESNTNLPQTENILSINSSKEEDLKSVIQSAVRSEMLKTAEQIGLGLLGGAIGSLATNIQSRNGNMVEEPTTSRPVATRESQTLPEISDPSLVRKRNSIHSRSKVSIVKERKGSDDATSSTESDRSDCSNRSKRELNPSKKSVLHKVPLLKADNESGKVSPKRYYVISDEKMTLHSSPQRLYNSTRVENRRQNPPNPVKLLKIENLNENKLISKKSLEKTINPDEVRRFVVAKVKRDEVGEREKLKLEQRRLLSISKQLSSDDGFPDNTMPSVDELNVKEKPKKQKSLGPKTLAKLAKLDLKLSFDEIERSRIEKPKSDNLNPQTPSVISPDSCAQLQYDVYERLKSAKEKSTNSTQTSLVSKDIGISTDGFLSPIISRDIGLMTVPSEAEMENERIKVFQKVLTSSKQTSISDDFETANRVNNNIIASPQLEEEHLKQDTFDSNTSESSEALTSPQISFCTKLEGLKKRLDSIDEISQNLGEELRSSKKAILEAENLANSDLNLNLREKSPGFSDRRKKESNSFEQRKSIILSLIDQKYKRALANYESGFDPNANSSESSEIDGKRSSISNNYTDNDYVIESDIELRNPIISSRSIGIEEENLIEPSKMRELYRIYGSRRIPDRVLRKIRSQYIAKRQSSL